MLQFFRNLIHFDLKFYDSVTLNFVNLVGINVTLYFCKKAFNLIATPIRQAKAANYHLDSRVLDINNVEVSHLIKLNLKFALFMAVCRPIGCGLYRLVADILSLLNVNKPFIKEFLD